MSTTHQGKPGGKPRQRKGKADQRSRKPDQQQSPKLDQRSATDQTGATVASTAASTHRTVAPVDRTSRWEGPATNDRLEAPAEGRDNLVVDPDWISAATDSITRRNPIAWLS